MRPVQWTKERPTSTARLILERLGYDGTVRAWEIVRRPSGKLFLSAPGSDGKHWCMSLESTHPESQWIHLTNIVDFEENTND
jgi:hypothetical protein